MKGFTGRRRCAWATLGLLIALAAACGDGETVEVISPSPGAEVTVPFEVTLDVSVPLGSPSQDLHHLHLWFGDDEAAYLVVEATTVEVTQAPSGEQELHLSLREPDHSETGVETSVPLVIRPGSDDE